MTLDISFKVRFLIGEEDVPLASELVVGADASQGGTENGFLFRLDLQPTDAPVQLDLGALIRFIELKLGAGAGSLQNSNGISTLQQIFPSVVKGDNFDSKNDAVILIRAFEINSSTSKKLFKINVDVGSSDPSKGFIPLPPAVASWLSIENLSISFSATSTKTAG
jgi:hypothetical protein